MIKGRVSRWFSQRGFGYIVRKDGQDDAFIHIRQLERSGIAGLEVGEFVEFELAARGDRQEVVNLRRLERKADNDGDGDTISAAPEWLVRQASPYGE